MRPSRRAIVKGVIAALIGIPVTVSSIIPILIIIGIGGDWIVHIVSLGVDDSVDIFTEARRLAQAIAYVLWGVAGLIGLYGFWAWVFCRQDISHRHRSTLATCIFIGVCAVIPILLIAPVNLHTAFAAIGCIAGLTICGWLVLPKAAK